MYYFIVNLTSRTGKAKEIWLTVEQELKNRKISYEAYTTEYRGHALELADRICSKVVAAKASQVQDEKACLVVVGGDGTVNEVVNGMHHFEEILFGYIATGSGNDLGRGLHISKDPIEALNGILNAKEVFPMDLAKLILEDGVSRYYAISSGIGIDAEVCKLTNQSRLKKILNQIGLGRLSYLLLTIKALFTMPTTKIIAEFEGIGKRYIDKMIFVAGMNQPWEGGGVPMAPSADCQDGLLSVCCVYGIQRWRTFFLLPFLVAAKHEGIRGVEILHCSGYELTLESPMDVHSDGEYLGKHKKIRYQCEKGKLQLLKG